MIMEAADTFKTKVMFLTVSPHKATLHTGCNQNYKCGMGGHKTL